MTQLSLLSNDEEGKVVCGDDEETIAKELKIVHEKDASGEITKTTYYFVLKNNVKFSNGTNLTMKDVLFNFLRLSRSRLRRFQHYVFNRYRRT